MLVLAEPQKVIGAHLARQTEPSRAEALPFPRHTLAFVIVVTNAKVFLEVFPRILEIVLRLRRDHVRMISRIERTNGVPDTWQGCAAPGNDIRKSV